MAGTLATLAVASALLCAGLIVALRPVLLRYALARPNARSSHRTPTPQGGGIAVLAATLAAGAGALALGEALADVREWSVVGAAAVVLAAVGATDDIRPLGAVPRLFLQFAAVAIVVVIAAEGVRILPAWTPAWLERGLLIVGGVWFVNLVNFMDGLDWMTVAEVVPITACLAGLGLTGVVPTEAALLAAALLGAILGFAPFNKPVARLFLGDVGSLPIGLLAGWMLLKLAGNGALAAAILLPLYYLADATITLLKRLARGERVWQAHRTHFYQQATDNGFSVMAVAAHVFGLNLCLAALALATLTWPAWPVQIGALSLGAGLVALVLKRFATPRLVQAAA
jgi:UDP-N-acetylmuramyl pentapeptide phosphotransferase/UDP-N-acetylglucosamine-1-phosphate transferase